MTGKSPERQSRATGKSSAARASHPRGKAEGSESTRYFHIHEDDELDEELLASWIRQASELPGEHLF